MTEIITENNCIVLHRIEIGALEIIVGERWRRDGTVMYLCASGTKAAPRVTVDINDRYSDIMTVFSEQIRNAAEGVSFHYSSLNVPDDDKRPLSPESCLPPDGVLYGKVVALSPVKMPPAERAAYRQFLFCTGGIGAFTPFGAGSCRCTELFSGKTVRCRRQDLIGIVKGERMPGWVAENLAAMHLI